MDNKYELHKGDCLEKLKLIEDKSINLAIYDVPYFSTNIKEVGDRQWKKKDDYIDWCLGVIKETQRVLKDNGSFYFFHNDIDIMTDILYKIKNETRFKLKNQIIWSKFNNWKSANIKDGAGMYRSILQCYGNQRSYNNSTTEYLYYFTFQEDTGLDYIQDNKMLYKELREYFWEERLKLKELTYKEINERIGFASNGGGVASGVLNSKKLGWRFPKKETYKKFRRLGIFARDYDELKDIYEEKRKEYEGLRYIFNQPKENFKGIGIEKTKEILKPYTTVWEYNRDDGYGLGHLTPKPIEMLKHIIKTSSNENDIVLDCCMGSGSTGVACLNTNRKFIGIELDDNYFNIAKERIESTYRNINKIKNNIQ